MDRVRLGIVGSGWAARTHLAALRDEPDVVVRGVASRHPSHAQALARQAGAGVPAYADHRALLDAGDLDAVLMCLPPDARGAPELDALDLGLHLLVEKPFTDSNPMAIIYKHRHQPVPRMPAGVSAWQPLVDKLLAKKPADRYASAEIAEAALNQAALQARTAAA